MSNVRVRVSYLLTMSFVAAGFLTTNSFGQNRPADLPRATPAEVGMSAERLERVRAGVQGMVDRHWTPGVVVLIARHGKVVQLDAFGKMDVDAGKAMRPDAIFRLRSMTKPITTVAALLLVDEGKLKLDDPVYKYLPELKGLRVYAGEGETVPANREMTVRDLMRHTAGLSYGYEGTPVDKLYDQNNIMDGTSADMVRKLGKLPLQYQPGTAFHYSYAADVLGRLIEVVSGQPLDEFCAERIFRPLDMRDTGFFVPADGLDRLTAGYRPDGQGGFRCIDAPATSHYRNRPRFLSGGGGMVSTARDYYRFCQMLLNGGELEGKRLLSTETVRAMTTNQLPPEALPISLGGFPLPGHGIGLGLLVRMEMKAPSTSPAAAKPTTTGAAATKPSKPDPAVGEWSWSGAASTFFWAAPRPELVVIILQQLEPLSLGLSLSLHPAVYGAVVD